MRTESLLLSSLHQITLQSPC